MARRTGSDGARTRAAICAAAIRLIARVGYEAVSMRRLAQDVGVGAAALYRYFPTKQAILFDLLITHMNDLLDAWAHARPTGALAPPDRLRAFARFHIRYHLDQPDNLFLSYMELRSLDAANFARIEDLRRTYEREVAEIIAAGIASRDFRPQDPRVTARAIIAMLNGLPVWFRDDGALGRDHVEQLYINMVAGLVGTAPVPELQETACFTPA
ncbi:MAG: TetR/AcrR family transcriptional regulator [Pseudomonadota bacterium]